MLGDSGFVRPQLGCEDSVGFKLDGNVFVALGVLVVCMKVFFFLLSF